MFNEKMKSDFDQGSTAVIDFLCPLWASMYKKLIEEGVPAVCALEMVKAFILKPSDPTCGEK